MLPHELEQAKPTDESETAGLAQILKLAHGSRVMLIRNVNTNEGLVNGAQGTMQTIQWGDDNDLMP